MIISVNPGAYLKFNFTGTSLSMRYEVSSVIAGVAAKQWPRVAISVDSGAYTIIQLALTDAGVLSLVTGLADATHTAVLYFTSSDAYTSRWDWDCSLRILALRPDAGKSILAPTSTNASKMIAFGDSITEGAWNLNAPGDNTNYSTYEDASLSWAQLVAASFSCELGTCGFGGQSWSGVWNGDIPTTQDAWDFYYSTNSRLTGGLLSPAPDWILCNTGTNGTAASAVVAQWLTDVRAAAPLAKIALIIPFGQQNVSDITAGFNAYQLATPDANCKLIDLGVIVYDCTDAGLHPSVAGHATIAALVIAALNAEF
jgi:lysophospholipase L1-like esterase